MHSRPLLRQLTAQALRHAPGRTGAAPSSTLAAPAAALPALSDADAQGQTSSSSWRVLVAAAAAGACGAAVAACESSSSEVSPPTAVAAQNSLLSREMRLRAFYDYERRLRERSGPDKIFEYFASVRGKDASYMLPIDFLRATVPVFPPYGSVASRSGYLPGENPASVATQPVGVPRCAEEFFNKFDTDGDGGRISYAEYVFFTTLVAIPLNEAAACFRMFDEDDSHSLDAGEFRAMMRVLRSQTRAGQHTGKAYSRITGQEGSQQKLDDACASTLFFGKNGKGTLSLRVFKQFIADLHAAVVALEFAHYDVHGVGSISPANFGLSLVAGAGGSHVDTLLKRCATLPGADGAPPPKKMTREQAERRISLADFRAFHALKDRLGELRCAVTAYDSHHGAMTKATFTAAVGRVCDIHLSPCVVDTLFDVFDVDGDGTLEPEELLDIMERRARLDAQRAHSKRGGEASGLGQMLRSAWAQLAGRDDE